VVKLLIQKGARIDAGDVNRKTPLHWAAFAGSTDAARLLIQKGEDVNASSGEH
jgi:ankyrin repeat protein